MKRKVKGMKEEGNERVNMRQERLAEDRCKGLCNQF